MRNDPRSGASALLVILAFGAIYAVWGSTYLAIRFAIETLPPFLMAGSRFAVAGVLVAVWAKARGATWPNARETGGATAVGALMLLGGNGLVTWAEQSVPSSIAALFVTTVPLWMTLLDGLYGGQRPRGWTWFGLALGLVGMIILVRPSGEDLHALPLSGSLALLLASFSWANGSLLSRRIALPKHPSMAVATEMLAAGLLLALVGTLQGEWPRFFEGTPSTLSVLSWVYLVFFGSIVALSAYMFLLRRASAAAVSTYAFVNPVVAVALGWALVHEPITPRVILAASLILGAVAVILVAWRNQEARLRASLDRPSGVDPL